MYYRLVQPLRANRNNRVRRATTYHRSGTLLRRGLFAASVMLQYVCVVFVYVVHIEAVGTQCCALHSPLAQLQRDRVEPCALTLLAPPDRCRLTMGGMYLVTFGAKLVHRVIS